MPRQSRSLRWSKKHSELVQDFDRIQIATWDDRIRSLNDRLFSDVAGQQWAGLVAEDDERPRLEINKVQGAVVRLEGEYRNNPVDVQFLPADGSKPGQLSDALGGIYRSDVIDSFGAEAMKNAAGDQIRGGYGAWRWRAKKLNEDDPTDERQRLVIEPLVDPEKSVFFDLDCKQQNKSDARQCFVLTTITPQEYERRYPKAPSPSSWPQLITQRTDWEWYGPEVVTIAEAYCVETEPRDFIVFRALDGSEFEREAGDFDPDDDDLPDEGEGPAALRKLLITGNEIVGEKTKKCRVIKKYTMSGERILNEERIAGRFIPVVVVYGKRSFVDNKERWSGMVRLTADAQRALNALTSWLFEIASSQATSTPLFAPEQIQAHQQSWTDWANGKTVAFLVADALKNPDGSIAAAPGPLAWTPVPQIPPALAQQLIQVGIDIKELTGSQEQGDKLVSNISGKAVEMVQRHLDAFTEVYVDNFAMGVQHSGVIWKYMAPEIYVEPERKLKTIGINGRDRGSITLAEPGIEDGVLKMDGVIDLDYGKGDFDVVTTVGPTSDTKRQAAAREAVTLLAVIPPEMAEAREDLVWTMLANVTGEGMGPLNEKARMKLLERGIGKPTPEQAAELQKKAAAAASQPNPQAEALAAQTAALAAEAEKQKALAAKAIADTGLSAANTEKAQAQTVETLAKARKIGVDGVVALAEASKPDPEPRQPTPNGAG